MEVLLLDQNCVEEAVVVAAAAAAAVEAVVGSSCLTFKFSGYCATIFMVMHRHFCGCSFCLCLLDLRVTHARLLYCPRTTHSRYMNIKKACLLLGLLAST